MKKTLLFLILLVSLITSCEKFDLSEVLNNEVKGAGEFVLTAYPIVSENGVQTRSIVSGSKISDYAERISYHITTVGNPGVKIKTDTQVYGMDEDFGTLQIRLDKGRYILTVIAYTGLGTCSFSDASSTFGRITFKSSRVSDTYLWCDTIEVISDMTQEVDLKECASKVIIKSSGEHPSNVKSLGFYYTGGSSTLNQFTGYGCVKSKQSVTLPTDNSEIYELYTFPYMSESSELSMTIYLQDSSEGDLDEITFPKTIPVKKGKVTEVTCSLYDRSFIFGNITIDTTWDTSDTIKIEI